MAAEKLQLDFINGTIHPKTGIGLVHHTVADLEKQLEFYQTVIGFQVHWQEEGVAGLGVGSKDLLILTESPGSKRYRGTTGMYHFAILVPNQRDLARVIARLYSIKYPNSPTDHLLTKTTYLDDPEGNNIEIYTESPEDGVFGFKNGQMIAQRADGSPSSGREPLDLEKLFSYLDETDKLEKGLPPETKIGHVHLYVSDLEKTLNFYHKIIGLDNMGVDYNIRMGMVSAGGYHHHVGFNTWLGENAPPSPPNALGLRYFTLVLPSTEELNKVAQRIRTAGIAIQEIEKGYQVKDPSQINLRLTT